MYRPAARCLVFVSLLSVGACDEGSAPNPIVNISGSGGSSASVVPGGQSGAGASALGNAGASNAGAGTHAGSNAGSNEGGADNAGTGGFATGGAATGGAGGAAGNPNVAGNAGAAGDAGIDYTAVIPSSGCGQIAPDSGTYMLQTLGTKPIDCADSQCGDWSSNREYSIFLPSNYDAETPYPLVFLGPGCGGDSTQIYSYSPSNGATVGDESADNRVIRIGLRPSAEIQAVHATNPNQGCFDDKEGDDSVDFVFYEDLYDLLETQLCFDRNRVFAGGNSSGAWLANELGCKYAGDSQRPIRGILPNGGGLPDQPQFMPTCSDKPMAGFWVFEVADTTHPFEPNHYAINHAMSANGCPMFATYDTADFENYPVDGLAENTCQTISNCDPFNPLVVCKLPGTGNNSHDEVVNPGAATFLQSFLAPPLAAP